MDKRHRVFLTGGTGYVGSRLIPLLHNSGCEVVALCRPESKGKLPDGCTAVTGNALDGQSYQQHVAGARTFVQLVGVSRPSPAKSREFVEVDLRSGLEAIRVAKESGIQHFVYLSVAHPAPVMKAYTAVRRECEQAIRENGLNSTIVRPWYVLGPGHRWPYALIPLYQIAEAIHATREGARRLGLVTIQEMVHALAAVVAHPAAGIRVVEVPEIRRLGGPKNRPDHVPYSENRSD